MYATTKLVYGTIIVSPNNKILLIKGRKSGKWSFPKGHAEQNETELECALRETYEETGLKLHNNFKKRIQLSTGVYFLYYISQRECKPIDTAEVIDIAWISSNSMKQIQVNVDINTFLRSYSKQLSI
jgi:8-oxo-dGTP pyrophosphatase MutT (NUDIX family)